MSEKSTTDSTQTGKKASKAGVFDVRNFIGALMGLYGVILVIAQFFDSEEQLAKADGLRVNLWTGLALLATSIIFIAWAKLRPIIVPPTEPQDGADAGH